MDKKDFIKGNMPDFMREAHELITMLFLLRDDPRTEDVKDAEVHALMDQMNDPHGVMLYLASYVAEDFPTLEDWSARMLETAEAFNG